MTRLKALKDLKAKVEAGEAQDADFANVWPATAKRDWGTNWLALKAYQGSLDAALRLHEAVLPDKGWGVEYVAKYPNLTAAGSSHRAVVGWGTLHKGFADTPARAWLLAILSALIAQEEQP
jgi:hypothetical protein